MFVTAYTPPKINWPGSRSSVQSRSAAALQAQPELRAPPLVRDRMESVCNAPRGPQVDSHAARQTQAQAQAQVDPAPALQARPSWLYRQCMQPGERKHATFPIVRAFAARIDANVQSVRNLGKGSTPRARIDSNALAAPSKRPSSPPQHRPTAAAPARQPATQASNRVAPPIKKTSAPPAPSAEKTTAPLATLVKKVTAPVGPQGGKESPPLTPPPVPVTQEPASLSRSSSSFSSSSSQSFLPEDLLKALSNNRCVQNLKTRTSEHNSESKGIANTPEQILPHPVNVRRLSDSVYQDLLAVLDEKFGRAGTEQVGPDKKLTGSLESLNDSGHGSPPPSPEQPRSPVAVTAVASDRKDWVDVRFGVQLPPGQPELLAALNKKLSLNLAPLNNETTV